MNHIEFDRKTFNWGCGLVYTLLQYLFVVGFVSMVCSVVMSATMDFKLTIPDSVLPVVVAYLFASIVGFPVVSIIKSGYKRLVEGSAFSYNSKGIVYDKLVSKHWTAVGHVEEHRIYSISKITTVTKSRFSYIIVGEIDECLVNNGRQLKEKKVKSVKIPNAYMGIERLIEHG